MDKLNEKINNSKFLLTLFSRIKAIYAAHLKLYINPATRPKQGLNEYGNETELYYKRIHKRYNNLSNHLEKLLLIPKYIDDESVKIFCDKNGIDEVSYYQYHFENFVIRLVSVLDLCAKLGNEVYKLGIEDKKCNWYAFVKHKEIIGKFCCTSLWDYAFYLDSLKTDRHLIIHAGGYESDKVKSIESNVLDDSLIQLEEVLKDWFDSEKKEEIKRLSDFMNNKIENSLNYVFNFLDTMNSDLISM